MDFTAIDFETANRNRLSACSIGIVVVQGGDVVDKYSSLIKPPTMDFSDDFIAMHGITPGMVQNAPTFQDIWPEINKRCTHELVVAHNASFDVGILIECLKNCGLPRLTGRYLCTVELARNLLPGLPNHRLRTLANLFGIQLDHHAAESDALACAKIAITLMRLSDSESLACYCRDLDDFGITTRNSCEFSTASVSLSIENLTDSIGQVEVSTLVQAPSADKRFEGKHFVFTGELTILARADAMNIVVTLGGEATNAVSRKTDYVVVGDEVLDTYHRTGRTTGKLARAVGLQKKGEYVQIINESEFLKMIK